MPVGSNTCTWNGKLPGNDCRELFMFTVAWPVAPDATVTDPKGTSVDSGENTDAKYWNVEAAQLAPLLLVMLRSYGTVAPATCGALIAGDSVTTGGW